MRSAQHRLYAGNRYAVLVILQGMGRIGKGRRDPTRDEWRQSAGCRAYAFRLQRGGAEASLSRGDRRPTCPMRGMISLFNRSYYEEVMVGARASAVPGTATLCRSSKAQGRRDRAARRSTGFGSSATARSMPSNARWCSMARWSSNSSLHISARRAEATLARSDQGTGKQLEMNPARPRRAAAVAGVPAGVRGGSQPDQHARGLPGTSFPAITSGSAVRRSADLIVARLDSLTSVIPR